MKKLFNLTTTLLITTGILFFSCEEGNNTDTPQPDTESNVTTDDTEDHAENEEESPLVGVWTFHSADIQAEINGHDVVKYLMVMYEISKEEAEEMLHAFKKKHDYENILSIIEMSSIEFKSDNTFTASSPAGEESGNWTMEANDALTLTYEEESQTVSIVSLDDDKIELQLDEQLEEDVDGDDNEDIISINVSLILEK